MELRETTEGDVLVLAPEGNLVDNEDTSAIDTRLTTALKAKVGRVVVDCAGVGLVSSSAIRILLMTMRKLERVQGRLVLCSLSAKVLSAFAISGFDKDFTVVGTREDALVRVREAVAAQPSRKPKRAPAPAPPPPPAAPPVAAAPVAAPVAAPPVAAAAPAAPVTPAPAKSVPAPVVAEASAPAPKPAPAAEPAAARPEYDDMAALLLGALAVPGVTGASRGTHLPDAEALAAGILRTLGTRHTTSLVG